MKYFWSLIFACVCGLTSAQDFRFFDTQDGLPSNLIYQTAQDTNGFIWIATPRGLCRFDGENFKNYTIEDGLVTNDIFSIAISEDNKVWFGAKSKYQGYLENGRIYLFPNEKDAVVTGKHVFPYKGGFGFCPYLKHLSPFGLEDSVWCAISLSKRRNERNLYAPIHDHSVRKGDYYLPISGRSYYFLNDSTIQHMLMDSAIYKTYLSEKLRPDMSQNHHRILMSDSLYGYFYYKEYFLINVFTGKCKIDSYHNKKGDIVETERVSHTYSNGLFYLRSKYLSLTFNKKGDLQKSFFSPQDFGQNFISHDFWGNIWMIGNSIGLGYMDGSLIDQTTYHQGENIKSIYLSGNSLYIATLQDSLCRLDIKTNQEKTLFHYSSTFYEFKKGIGNDVLALTNNHFGSIGKSQHCHQFNQLSLPPRIGLKSFEFYQDGFLLASHLAVFRFKNQAFQPKSIARGVGLSSIEQFDSSFYVSSVSGLKIWKDDSIFSCPIPGLPEDIPIKKLKPYYSKYLFAATEGYGIFAIDGDHYFEIPATNGLSVENIFVENDTAVWLATQKGVFLLRVDPENITSSSIQDAFYQCDGLVSSYVNDVIVTDSTIYVATDKGLSALDKNLLFNQNAPPLYLDAVSSGKRRITSSSFTSAYGSGPLIVKYGVICFSGREHLKFHYKRNHGNWISTSSQELNFNDLKPGNHEIQIKVTDHHSNTSIQKLTVYISPLWWQTTWFRISATLGALVILYLLYLLTKKRVANKEQEKADFNHKLSSLELMALRSQMNPHFVFNSLGAIQYYIQENHLELSEKYLVKFSKLIRLFFEYSRLRVLSLNEEIELLQNYLELEKMRFGEKLDFSICVDNTLNIDELNIPSMLLQPLVENAVNHGLFHKKGKGKVEIQFLTNQQNNLDVYIKDDGIGIKKGIAISQSSTKNYRSSSTKVIQENVALLNQQGDWQIHYSIEALYPEKLNSGTTVHLNFKLKHRKLHENQNSTR